MFFQIARGHLICSLFLIVFCLNSILLSVVDLYNVLLISAVQQSDSVIHTYIHIHSFSYSCPLWFITGY